MPLPIDSRLVYWTWLLYRESYERTGEHFGVSRGNVYKRVKKIEARIMAGCECHSWRCHCG